ncbi:MULTISPECIES: dodecin domain-containing protein [Chitinophaga]|nr:MULTISPECIES: dodecin domain-containing protein [Chitinophaga]
MAKTIHNIGSVYVNDFKVHVQHGEVSSHGVTCNVSFRVDGRQ